MALKIQLLFQFIAMKLAKCVIFCGAFYTSSTYHNPYPEVTSHPLISVSVNRLNPLITPPVEKSPMMTLSLQEVLIIGASSDQVKFSELTLDMFRMLQTLEREPQEDLTHMYDTSPGSGRLPPMVSRQTFQPWYEKSCHFETRDFDIAIDLLCIHTRVTWFLQKLSDQNTALKLLHIYVSLCANGLAEKELFCTSSQAFN